MDQNAKIDRLHRLYQKSLEEKCELQAKAIKQAETISDLRYQVTQLKRLLGNQNVASSGSLKTSAPSKFLTGEEILNFYYEAKKKKDQEDQAGESPQSKRWN